jgi:hypothetical protein
MTVQAETRHSRLQLYIQLERGTGRLETPLRHDGLTEDFPSVDSRERVKLQCSFTYSATTLIQPRPRQ